MIYQSEWLVNKSKAVFDELRNIEDEEDARKEITSYLEKVESHPDKEEVILVMLNIQWVLDEFPEDITWINSKPLRIKEDMKGKIVLIDFWTYCCINCLHVLPILEQLEKKYEYHPELMFVGCHSGKFSNERSTDRVREAVMKYDVTHPVINDKKMLVWKMFARRCWPSFALIGPDGYPIFFATGETVK